MTDDDDDDMRGDRVVFFSLDFDVVFCMGARALQRLDWVCIWSAQHLTLVGVQQLLVSI